MTTRSTPARFAAFFFIFTRGDRLRDSSAAVFLGPKPRVGWLLNMVPATFQRGDAELSGLELFLLSADAKDNFRVTVARVPPAPAPEPPPFLFSKGPLPDHAIRR